MLKLLAALALVSAGALFHTELKSSFPEKDAILTSAPMKVTLTFTGKVDAKLSSIAILKPDSTEMAKLQVRATDDAKTIEAAIPRQLPPGRYVVRWRTASADGHPVRNAYAFSINVVE